MYATGSDLKPPFFSFLAIISTVSLRRGRFSYFLVSKKNKKRLNIDCRFRIQVEVQKYSVLKKFQGKHFFPSFLGENVIINEPKKKTGFKRLVSY